VAGQHGSIVEEDVGEEIKRQERRTRRRERLGGLQSFELAFSEVNVEIGGPPSQQA
jgi:hypothetical protein